METDRQSRPRLLVREADRYVALAPGALHYLVRHSFRDGIFEFKAPYEDEAADFGYSLVALIALAIEVGWFRAATAPEIASHWARVPELKAALTAAGRKANGKRADLLAAVLAQEPAWIENFGRSKPAFYPTDKGRIELQATRPVKEVTTRESHLKTMRSYFDRDLKSARQEPCILGIKIWARVDAMWEGYTCPLASRFVGVFLPDEVPELYPDDCPEEYACCCVSREIVLVGDDTPEADLLRAKIKKREIAAAQPHGQAVAPKAQPL